MRGSRNFCQFLFSPQLILQFTEGSNNLLQRKLYLYFTKDPRGSTIFQKGGCPTFSRGGVQMLISLETHIRTCYFSSGGGGMSGPPIPLLIRTWAMLS